MAKKSVLPKRIYVQLDSENGYKGEDLVAWRKLDGTNDGHVAVYELVDELEKREATEIRRKGTKNWFKGRA